MSETCSKFFYGNCPIIKQENEDLIKAFLTDLNSNMLRKKIVKKWEGKLKEEDKP